MMNLSNESYYIYWKFENGRPPFVENSRTATIKGNGSVSESEEKKTCRLIGCQTVSDSPTDLFKVQV